MRLLIIIAMLVSAQVHADPWSYLDENHRVYLWNWKCEGIRLLVKDPGRPDDDNTGFQFRIDKGEMHKAGYGFGMSIDRGDPENYFSKFHWAIAQELMNGKVLYIKDLSPGSKTIAVPLDNFKAAYEEQLDSCADPLKEVWLD